MTARQLSITDQDGIGNYIDVLASKGHEVKEGEQLLGGVKYRCHNCHKEFRLYNRGDYAVFSDFEEDDQCGHRQMNILTLITGCIDG